MQRVLLLSVVVVLVVCDHLRPLYHVRPPKNWINDPNGPVYWSGKYHVFMQYNPFGTQWGNMSWYHMMSVGNDLAGPWRSADKPLALVPSTTYDFMGCFSGSISVVDGGVPILMYTGQSLVEMQVVATTSDLENLQNWTKRGVVLKGKASPWGYVFF